MLIKTKYYNLHLNLLSDKSINMNDYLGDEITLRDISKMESIFGQKSSSSQPSSSSTSSTYVPGQYSMPQSFQGVQSQIDRARNWIQNNLKCVTETLRQYINQYPPLAAFLFTLLILSAVPVAIFVVFGVSTTVFFLTIALIGFSAVEGTILLTSGGILLAILSGIALFTTCTFGFLALSYMGYKGTCSACSQLWQGASYIGNKVQEQSQSMMPQTSSMMSGSSGGSSSFQQSSPSSQQQQQPPTRQ